MSWKQILFLTILILISGYLLNLVRWTGMIGIILLVLGCIFLLENRPIEDHRYIGDRSPWPEGVLSMGSACIISGASLIVIAIAI